MSDSSVPFSIAYPAPAKLNLMLRVVGRRPDGYHLLQTVFRFIDYGDRLRFRVRQDGVINRVNDIEGVPADSDLTVRADIVLDKRLPLGGGLGGGSSDAATTLLALNQLWGTSVARTQLVELAVKLGADVPVFVFGENAFAEGIGEQLQALQLAPAWYLVLCPPVAVSTAAVFTHPGLKRDSIKVTIQSFSTPVGGAVVTDAVNDLQVLVASLYPQVARYLAWLEQHGPALMTGSGACVFAPYDSEAAARNVLARLPADMQGFVAQGLMHHPLRDIGS
jgi:4-diphosphocytidyl-2-C-methyl-D-erythritol kinase